MLESLQNENLEYQKLSQEEQQKRGILGRLIGVVADFMAPTRNGRHYSEELWEKVFDDPIMKERIENGVCFGELCHPTDREETDMEKVAVCMPEVPKKNKDGKLTAVFDILDTPNGRILKTLCDYGSTLGVSSRGSGDTFMGKDGNEEVDPDSYTCQGFDIVLIPAVKSARLQYVTESLDTKKSLKESLQDIVSKASDNDKKIMEETIDNLELDEALGQDYSDIPEIKSLNYSQNRDANNVPGINSVSRFISAIEEVGEPIFKIRSSRMPISEGDIKDGWMDIKRRGWSVKKDWDTSLSGFNEVYICKKLDMNESLNESLDVYDIENVLKRLKDYVNEYYEEHGSEWTDISEPSQIKDLERVINYLYILQSEKPEFFESLEENSTSSFDIDEVTDDGAVVDDEAIFEELQTVLKQRQEAEQKVIELNEKLSVCYAKEESVNNRVTSLKSQIEKLTESSNQVAALKTKVSKFRMKRIFIISSITKNTRQNPHCSKKHFNTI